MFKPSEIEYYIELAKKNTLTDENMEEIFEKALQTYEIELCKLGLDGIF